MLQAVRKRVNQMAMPYPSEPEKQHIIDRLHQMQPTYDQIGRACRLIVQEQPHDVYPLNSTIIQALSALVDRAAQKGTLESLVAEFHSTIFMATEPPLIIKKPLDADLANQFGSMFTTLLHALEQMTEGELEQYSADIDTADMTNFEDKLENKAKFSKDKRELAFRSRRKISVLQRMAKKLGYPKYNKLKKRVMYLYFRLCSEYPAEHYRADFRFEKLLEHLYEQLPAHIREHFDESLEHLTGVIFDTAYDCYIFNE